MAYRRSSLNSEIEDIVANFTKRIGPVDDAAFVEIVPEWPPIVVHKISPSAQSDCVTIFTTGMSENFAENSSAEHEINYPELFMQLEPAWPLQPCDMDSLDNRWPIEYLRSLARLPQSTGGWEGAPVQFFLNESPADTMSPKCSYAGSFAFQERRFVCRDNKCIAVYRVTPLYWEELELAQREGIPALLQAFDDHKISMIVSRQRANVGMLTK